MNVTYRTNLHMGSGKPGKDFMEKCEKGARDRDMLKEGEPNLSAFIRHCVEFTLKSEKI